MDAKRDWGFAGDYVDGMYRMMTADRPDSYVLATNKTTSVRDFVSAAFAVAGIELHFEGDGVNERGLDSKGVARVVVDPQFFRPAEVDLLLGDYTKAKEELGWAPGTSVDELIEQMVAADLERERG